MITTTWGIDPAHSEIQFKVKHLMITTVTGSFAKIGGLAQTDGDNFNNAHIEFTADIASVSTNNEQRDAHLRSADFFDAEQFPQLKFVSTNFRSSSPDQYTLEGNLELHGITKPVSLAVEFTGIQKDPWGNTKAGFELQGKINRKDFGLTWNAPTEAGGMLVGEEVKLSASIQLAKQ
ncbi:MAG: YceI family protein [Bernardetiaceae bacterium]|jgi:polyisoprenoid-binding protein YceI|nr:YceI family protein [Bernardetiaceae bacterium]